VFLWLKHAEVNIPINRQSPVGHRVEWQASVYHNLVQMLQHPLYVDPYAFGRRTHRTRHVNRRMKSIAGLCRRGMSCYESVMLVYQLGRVRGKSEDVY